MNTRGKTVAPRRAKRLPWLFNTVIMAIVMAAFVVLNVLTPEYHDDFVYKFMFEGGSVNYGHPVSSLGDIFISQVDQYCSVNGRSIVHVFVQLFTGVLGKSVFNVITNCVHTTGTTLSIWYIRNRPFPFMPAIGTFPPKPLT